MLNIDDFKGRIRILMKAQGNAEAVLVDDDEARIYVLTGPNLGGKSVIKNSVYFR